MEPTIKPTYNDGIITTPDTKYRPDPRGAGYAIFTHLQKHSNKIMQVDGYTGEEDTFRSALQRSIRIAIKLQEYGIKPTDTVSICTSHHLNSCVAVFASLFVGAKVVCFDHQMHVTEATLLMNQVDPKLIFVGLEGLNFIETLMKSSKKKAPMIVFGQTSAHANFFDFLSPRVDEEHFTPVEVDESETAFIFFSSGSSGLPKGICLSHRAYLEQVSVALDLDEPFDRVLVFSTLYWAINVFYWGVTIINGYCRVILNFTEDLVPVWNGIETYKPTFLFLNPFKMRTLCDAKPIDVSGDSFQKIFLSGGPVFEHELTHYRKMFPKAIVTVGYGLTEVGLLSYFPSTTETDLKRIETKPNSIGSVLNGTSYRVVNPDTEQVLGPYKKGELRVKTKGALSGYYQINTTEAFDVDGWFKTGDLVYYDEDYYLYYVERFKELIKYQSWHVAPKIIENVLMSRDDIGAACVVGIPHDVDDEHPMAFVELNETCKNTHNIEEDICEHVERLLGNNFKLRGGVKIVDKMPFTPTGKYDARKLKREFLKDPTNRQLSVVTKNVPISLTNNGVGNSLKELNYLVPEQLAY